MIGPRGDEEQSLRQRCPPFGLAFDQQLAYLLCTDRASRLAREDDALPSCFKARLEPTRMSGFAGPLPSLEADQPAASIHSSNLARAENQRREPAHHIAEEAGGRYGLRSDDGDDLVLFPGNRHAQC